MAQYETRKSVNVFTLLVAPSYDAECKNPASSVLGPINVRLSFKSGHR